VTTPPTTAALVLAAGRSIRFGAATKQLADVDGRPLVAQVVATALATDVDEVVVVVGHDADRVAAAVPDDPRVRTVTNPDPAAGIAASLCTGVAALAHTVERLVILLGDQPGIDPALVDRVLAAVTDHPAARVRYRDHPGHPVAFARPAFTGARRAHRRRRGAAAARAARHPRGGRRRRQPRRRGHPRRPVTLAGRERRRPCRTDPRPSANRPRGSHALVVHRRHDLRAARGGAGAPRAPRRGDAT
jgi:molybdenum cofactor cytidylyltransferase